MQKFVAKFGQKAAAAFVQYLFILATLLCLWLAAF